MSIEKSIVIVGGNPYNHNLGVGALGYSALAMLNDILLENHSTGVFTFLGSSRDSVDKIAIKGRDIQFDNVLAVDFFSFKTSIKNLFFKKRFKLDRIQNPDFVFDISEGDSFSDIYGKERFYAVLNSKIFFRNKGIKQALLPQTIGPFKSEEYEREAFEVMNDLNMVMARDKQSYDYAKKFLPKEKISETIDLAFYLPYEKQNFPSDVVNVGINVSGLLWNGGYTRNNQFNMKTDYQELVRNTIEYFLKQPNVQLYLVPHVITQDGSVEDDLAVSTHLESEYPGVKVAPIFNNPIEAKSYISGLDFFTGARMHACIAAFSSGVPVFPLAYSRKFNGLFGETLQFENFGDCVNSDGKVVFEKLINSFENRGEHKMKFEKIQDQIIKPRLQLLKSILTKFLI
jgi:colanic acid/amylovoran biosynthesis protein